MYLVLCVGGLSHVLALAALGSMFAKRRAMPLGFGAATLLSRPPRSAWASAAT
jgi:hypothetical protein